MTYLRSALCAASLMFALPASADKIPLSEISDYLNSLQTVKADFIQAHDDGTMAMGTLSMKRPGRLRLDYGGGPESPLLMASGGQIAIFDPRSNEPPIRYPLGPTPLSLVLKRNVDLTTERMVVDHVEVDESTIVRAQDPNNPEYGAIDIIFSQDETGAPVLNAWVIYDGAGGVTEVSLMNLEAVDRIPDILFNIRKEAEDRGVPIE